MSDGLAEILSRRMKLHQIAAAGLTRAIAATGEERAALAGAFGIPAIAVLEGVFVLRRAGSEIAAELSLRARVTQLCVVTLEAFDSEITETAQLRFVPAAEADDTVMLTPENLEDPDALPYTGDSIDLGAALAEQLALALDPYPRRPGAELPQSAEPEALHPLAGLAMRKPGQDAS